jgi:CheY-like chemotaxis protein
MSEEKQPAVQPTVPVPEPPATVPISPDIIPQPPAAPQPEAAAPIPAAIPAPTPAAPPAESAPVAPIITPPTIPATPPATAPLKMTEPVPAPVVSIPTPAPGPAPALAVSAAPAEIKPLDWKQIPRYALVIDDEPANRDFLVRLLEQARFQVKGASSALEALRYAQEIKEGMCVVAIDNLLPDMGGIDLLIKLRPIYPSARMIMATMLDERSLMAKAFENGCDVFLVKPHGFMELFRRLQAAVTTGQDELKRLIIDQYGPRPYRS